MTAKIKKEKKSILLENTFLPFGVEMLFSWFMIVLITMYLHLQTGICASIRWNVLTQKIQYDSIVIRKKEGTFRVR